MRRFALALLLALVTAGCEHEHNCCAFPHDFRVRVVDESGSPVPGAAIRFARTDGRDSIGVELTDSTGTAAYFSEDSALYEVSITPPRGFALADSSRSADTVLHHRTTNSLEFVLRRPPR